jgi:Tfp pilus assembly protein PilF
MSKAQALEDARKPQEAAALYQQIRQTDSSQAWNASWKLAHLYLRYNELDRAEQEFQYLGQYQPRKAEIQCALGDISSRRGHFAIAERMYRAALSQQPDHKNALAGLGMASAHNGNYDESVTAFKQLYGSESDALCEVAFVMKTDGKHMEAMQKYQAALSKDPNNLRASNELAKLHQASPNTTVRLTTPHAVEKRGAVELEPAAPFLASEGSSRLMEQRPTLPPLPQFDLNDGAGREGDAATQKK